MQVAKSSETSVLPEYSPELKNLAQNIQKLRKVHNMTQEELAWEAGTTTRTIQRLESGKDCNPSAIILLGIAHSFHCTLDVLFRPQEGTVSTINPSNNSLNSLLQDFSPESILCAKQVFEAMVQTLSSLAA